MVMAVPVLVALHGCVAGYNHGALLFGVSCLSEPVTANSTVVLIKYCELE